MAKIISGDKSGGQYSADLQTVINLLDGHDAGATAPTLPDWVRFGLILVLVE